MDLSIRAHLPDGGRRVAVLLVSLSSSSARASSARTKSGLVIKRFGPPLPAGRIIALDGEAGYQARLLPPGLALRLWRWRYKVVACRWSSCRRARSRVVVAKDGAAIPPSGCSRARSSAIASRTPRRSSDGGERGRQLAILTAGTYRINPALFEVVTPATREAHGMSPETCASTRCRPIASASSPMLDGRPIPSAISRARSSPVTRASSAARRSSTPAAAAVCRRRCCCRARGTSTRGSSQVEQVPLTEIPIGYVGVVVSYVGGEHLDVSGDAFTHGDLVERGRKGVWVEPLLPGKHPLNTRVMKVELVPTTNIVLNWAQRTEAHHYDERLSSITVRSKDGFSFSLDVSQIIHIGMKNAPRVISRVGSMQNLVDHVLQPTVGNYFRNSAQQVTVLEFLWARSDRQRRRSTTSAKAIEAYDVECIDTLIGDIAPPAELMKTQTDRKIAEELQRTYDAQREAQIQRQTLERETAVANLQAEVVRSEQMVRISQQNALAVAESPGARRTPRGCAPKARGCGPHVRRRRGRVDPRGWRGEGRGLSPGYRRVGGYAISGI